MKLLVIPDIQIHDMTFCSIEYRKSAIQAAKSSRDLTKDMVRVKSSNLWGYNINIKNDGDDFGDVYVQFKDKNGRPEDIYVYYDVPVKIYQRWHSSPSKGHYFWKHIRGKFAYSKLTGDKRTKQKGGIDYETRRKQEARQQESETTNEETA